MRFAGCRPSDARERERHRCIPSAEFVPQPTDAGTTMFGVLHHSHDSHVAGIHCQFFSTDVQGGIAIYGARKHFRAWRFGDLEWLTREVSFVHPSVTLSDDSIDGANFMWKYDERVSDGNILE